MKLLNKKTGKIVPIEIHNIGGKNYESLKEINEDWIDYEEPKVYWIDDESEITEDYWCGDDNLCEYDKRRIEIGNYFRTKEEAERALEKLKAWKRLKDRGFKFEKYETTNLDGILIKMKIGSSMCGQDFSDLDVLFGGKE